MAITPSRSGRYHLDDATNTLSTSSAAKERAWRPSRPRRWANHAKGTWRGDHRPQSGARAAYDHVMRRVEDYALIGDLQTAALVGREGSIDWCCFPRFDSAACFAALLGGSDDGRWSLAPATGVRRVTRRYRHDTLILESVFETDEGVVRAIDFMPPRDGAPEIMRIVEGLDGAVPMRSELVVRFDYGRIVPWVRRVDHARVAIAGPDGLCYRSRVDTRGED